MANQENFTEQINPNDKRFSVSRLANIPSDTILFAIQPADFGFYENDNVEIHFYSKLTDLLVYSSRISLNDDVLSIKTTQYIDGKFRNYINFDFNKFIELYPLSIGPGEYRVVLNIFSDELGGYEDKKLVVDVISDTRTEVNLRFKEDPDDKDLEELNYFMVPSIGKAFVDGILQNILLKGNEALDETIGITVDRVVRELNALGQSFELIRTSNIGKLTNLKEVVLIILIAVYERIQIELVSFPRNRASEDEVKLIIERIFYEEFDKVKDLLRSDIVLT